MKLKVRSTYNFDPIFCRVQKISANQKITAIALAIVLEDFEEFSYQALQDLIANLNEHQDTLPFILVFGIATTVEAIHRSLPHGTTSKLAIESFASAPSIHLLAKFVESIVFVPKIPSKMAENFNCLVVSILYSNIPRILT